MGCFLTLTERDFERLSSSLKAGINIVDNPHGEVKIEVKPTAYQSAREMARLIRNQAKSAQVTDGSAKESKYAVATTERFHHMASTLSKISPSLLPIFFNDTKKQFNIAMVRAGKLEAEPIAAEILVQSGYLDGGQKYSVTRSTGIDIQGKNVANTQVVVEVKLSVQEKEFGARMTSGSYEDEIHPEGYRQMSNGWLSKVSADFDPAHAHILGVHIDPAKEKVTIYRRTDAEARCWQPLVTKSLSEFKF